MADDLLQGLKDAVQETHDQNGEVEPKATMEEVVKALESMPGLSALDKATLLRTLTGESDSPKPPIGVPISNPWVEFVILFSLISLVILLLGYIGFRLYENALTRQNYREIKKQKKEQRKKK